LARRSGGALAEESTPGRSAPRQRSASWCGRQGGARAGESTPESRRAGAPPTGVTRSRATSTAAATRARPTRSRSTTATVAAARARSARSRSTASTAAATRARSARPRSQRQRRQRHAHAQGQGRAPTRAHADTRPPLPRVLSPCTAGGAAQGAGGSDSSRSATATAQAHRRQHVQGGDVQGGDPHRGLRSWTRSRSRSCVGGSVLGAGARGRFAKLGCASGQLDAGMVGR
jgi:hypothetical protein